MYIIPIVINSNWTTAFVPFSRKMSQQQIRKLSEFLIANKHINNNNNKATWYSKKGIWVYWLCFSAEALPGFCDSLPPLHFLLSSALPQWVMILYPIGKESELLADVLKSGCSILTFSSYPQVTLHFLTGNKQTVTQSK